MSKTKAFLMALVVLALFLVFGALVGRLVEWASQSNAIYWLFGVVMLVMGVIVYRELRSTP